MKILITGGAGFIGSRLGLALKVRGHEVTVLDNLSPQVHTADPEQSGLYLAIRDALSFIRADVTDRDAMAAAVAGQEVVVQLAAETGTGQSMYQVERYCRVNIGGTAVLLDLLANGNPGVRRVIIASSRAVYGEGKYLSKELGAVYPAHRAAADMSAGDFEVKYPGSGALQLQATDEASKLHPSSIYGITKLTQEQMVMTTCPGMGVEPVAFRYQNVYGPGQSLSNPYTGILSIFSNLILKRQPINIFEDGRESRDFVFVDDVVAATIAGIEKPAAAGEVFNVGSGVPVSVLEVARTLQGKYGIEVPTAVSGNFRIGDIRHNYASLEHIRRVLGFEPEYSFARGIGLFCDWVRSVGAAESDYARSLSEMRERGLLK